MTLDVLFHSYHHNCAISDSIHIMLNKNRTLEAVTLRTRSAILNTTCTRKLDGAKEAQRIPAEMVLYLISSKRCVCHLLGTL